MEVIRLSGYTTDEKLQIARNYLVPKQFNSHGIKSGELEITDSALVNILKYYTREAGVRHLDREIAKISRKAVRDVILNNIQSLVITNDNLAKYLGVAKYTTGEIEKRDLVGITTGLAYTEVGGDILAIEVLLMVGKGELKITGKLGEVMKESAQAALSYVRSKAHEFGIHPHLFRKRDIHIHVPEGATPKDGPSAGIALFTSLVSALTGVSVRNDVAMTGEITLRGRVLPVGGLKEKLLAAVRAGVKTAIIPHDNLPNLEEIPQSVKEHLTIIPVENADQVLALALTRVLEPIEWQEEWSELNEKFQAGHSLHGVVTH